jgi:glycosyltransferase involved in cell wall biosynthesis
LRVAIVHYWLLNRRGGERVVEALCRLFPQADIFSLLCDPESLSPALRKHRLTTSFLQRLPGSQRWHRHLLPLMPLAVEQFDLRDYDLVISSESGPAKGVLTSPGTCHICYCHTPMRYAWDFYHDYKNRSGLGPLRKSVFALATHYARLWDHAAADRVDYFAANSYNVARRIKKFYRREAEVIYPPVEVSSRHLSGSHDDYYLVVGQLVAYKRADLAIEACNRLGRPLRIVGNGEEYERLSRLAGSNVTLLSGLTDDQVRSQYAQCRALIFPGEEDFGIVPVEAQAFGKPVIAFGRGGVCETVIPAEPEDVPPHFASGVFFHEPSVDSLCNAILSFEKLESHIQPEFVRSHALQFDSSVFLKAMSEFVLSRMEEFRTSHSSRPKARASTAI